MSEAILSGPPAWHHRLSVRAHIGALQIDAEAQLAAPWTILFGPSGSGKTTLLKAVCGLLPSTANVSFERCGPDGPIQPLSLLPPHRRSLAYAPQHAALFPHLTVAQNVGFSYLVCAEPARDFNLVEEVISLFKLHTLGPRYPRDLSGGERRRVSLARALATPQARLVLLDEPFTGLDRATRNELLPALSAHLAARNLPVLSVTHDLEETLLLDADMLVMDAGRITRRGPAREVLAVERANLLSTLRA